MISKPGYFISTQETYQPKTIREILNEFKYLPMTTFTASKLIYAIRTLNHYYKSINKIDEKGNLFREDENFWLNETGLDKYVK